MSASIDADFLRAKSKIKRGTDFRDTVDVDIGGEDHTFGFRLLNEDEFDDVSMALPIEEMQGNREGLSEEEQERLQELAEKDQTDLTEEEQERLQELAGKSETLELFDALDEEANEALRWAGKQAILPAPEDVRAVKTADFSQKVELLGKDIANTTSENQIENALKANHIEPMIDDQPFPIKRTVGLRAFIETFKVRGNGLGDE